LTFRELAQDYLRFVKFRHRSYSNTVSQVNALTVAFGDRKVDDITTANIEDYLRDLREGASPSKRPTSEATVNRYRDRLSAMFRRAVMVRAVGTNPVKGIPKFKESGGRLAYLPADALEERAVVGALPPNLRPHFLFSLHTGVRWSEQVNLRWRDVDLLAGIVTMSQTKNGYTRQIPMNAVVRSVLIDLGAARPEPSGPEDRVFPCRYRAAAKFFPRAVAAAQAQLCADGRDAVRLDGYTWHSNRHTFASRLVMAGVDLLTVKELGGWRTLSMVQRYAHLAPGHLQDAVDRLVSRGGSGLDANWNDAPPPGGRVS
jgi:site-specific recombinase XerD